MRQAETYEELKPLIALCKAGKLFEIQEWIAAGKPVNPPPPPEKGHRPKSPLQVTIDKGFHSLVKVLLDGGADIDERYYCPLSHAVSERRKDIVELLVEYGADINEVDMLDVFQTWDPKMMEFFIERGADVETGNPLAAAFTYRIRTALKILKQYEHKFPSFHEQTNIALRYHCKEKSQKWVSLMLWAGADPYEPGEADYYAEPDEDDEGLSALGYAALYKNFEIFKMKQIRINPDHPAIKEVVRYAAKGEGIELIQKLLEKGMNPNDLENGGCSMIPELLQQLEWSCLSLHCWDSRDSRQKQKIDTDDARDKMKAIHILVKHGALWIPQNQKQIGYTRRSILKMIPDYTVEFIWIMAKYKACSRQSVEELIRTPSMRAHIQAHRPRVNELLEQLTYAASPKT